ncbi:tetratricopeptide repeat protein [Bacillus sp. SCS-151]|uniref:tetratricopeptide repeat protein n=1 Tax=Nanhaiella sioensis TaxID=3115293 RepID=UPI0039799BA3
MNIGRLIFFHRKRRGMTQAQLADGVCSVSHLSKIENNSKEMSEETQSLLFKKLNIKLYEEEHRINTLKKDIHLLHKEIIHQNKSKSQEIFLNISKVADWIEFTPYIFLYKIVIFRFYLFLNNISEAKAVREQLSKQKNKLSNDEKILFMLCTSIYLLMKNKLQRSLDLLISVEKLSGHNPPIELNYYFSLLYGRLNKFSLSMLYGNKALLEFQNSNNYLRVIDTQMILAIDLKQVGAMNESLDLFLKAGEMTDLVQDINRIAKIFHNIGDLYYWNNNYEEASYYFTKSIENKEYGTEDYIKTLSGLAEVHMLLGEKEKAKDLVVQTLKLSQQKNLSVNVTLFTIYSIQLENNFQKLYSYLESYAIPFFIEKNRWHLVSKYGEIIASYHADKQDYKKANEYLTLCNQALQNQYNNERIPLP